jgi:hypothetical protein
MAYRLPLTTAGGERWQLDGTKDVGRKRGLDVWPATATLHVILTRLVRQTTPARREQLWPPLDSRRPRTTSTGVNVSALFCRR